MNRLLLLMGVLFFSGCAMVPFYHRPSMPVSNQWSNVGANNLSGNGADIGWRNFYKDARLIQLIEIALTNNRDLRAAVLNVEAVQAQYRIGISRLLPTVEVQADGARSKQPTSKEGEFEETGLYNARLGLTSYEVDFFGRVRSLKAKALQNYLATQEAAQNVRISLISQVAIQYLTMLQLEQQMSLTADVLKSQEAYYQLIKRNYDLGNASALDLSSVKTQVASARVNAAEYERQYNQARNGLVLLVGQNLPNDLPPSKSLNDQDFVDDLPAGLPSDLLQKRPDILAAEHDLKAANANIGAARAAFFPKITLTASGGLSSLALSDLFTPGGPAWKFMPQITMPIFDGGATKINLDLAHIQKRREIARYEGAIQNAFREVSDALIARATYLDQIKAQQDLVKAQSERYKLADLRYRNGVDSYLNVLSAQQDLYGAQQVLIQTQFNRIANLITLYKALGGGWHENSAT